MTRTFESKSDVNERPSFAALPMVPVLIAGIVAFSTITAAQNDERVKAGLTTWKTAGCVDCHGPFADGNQDDDDFPAGADLRTTRLDAVAQTGHGNQRIQRSSRSSNRPLPAHHFAQR